AAILRAAARAARAADPRTSFFGAWILCFWAGQSVQMLSGDLLTYWRVLPVYFWVLALAVRLDRAGRMKPPDEARGRSPRMRLLFLDQFSDPGGAQQCLLDLLP